MNQFAINAGDSVVGLIIGAAEPDRLPTLRACGSRGCPENTSIQAGDISVQVIRIDSQATVEIAGRVTTDSSSHLRLLLLRLLGNKTNTVVIIDVSKVSYMDTSGIATLLEALKAAQERSVKLRLVGANGQIRMLAEGIELHKIFSAFKSEVVFT